MIPLQDSRFSSLDTPARLRQRTAHHRLEQPRQSLSEEQALDAAYWIVAGIGLLCVVAVLVSR